MNFYMLEHSYLNRTTNYSWYQSKRFRTTIRQVSRLIDHRICRLPGYPVAYWLQLPKYGDEFVQDSHLFPFSPEPTAYILTQLFRHLNVTYSTLTILTHIHQLFNHLVHKIFAAHITPRISYASTGNTCTCAFSI